MSRVNMTGRAETEQDIRAMDFDGTVRKVFLGDPVTDTTWGFFEIKPKVQLENAQVIDDCPTLIVPRAVPGLTMDVALRVDGEGSFTIIGRFPGTDPGLVELALMRAA